jgi:hypothetical protein
MKMRPNCTHSGERDRRTRPDRRGLMTTADELRAEAVRMRGFALTVTDPEVLAEIHAMVEKWERRARQQGDGRPSD